MIPDQRCMTLVAHLTSVVVLALCGPTKGAPLPRLTTVTKINLTNAKSIGTNNTGSCPSSVLIITTTCKILTSCSFLVLTTITSGVHLKEKVIILLVLKSRSYRTTKSITINLFGLNLETCRTKRNLHSLKLRHLLNSHGPAHIS